MSDIIRIKDVDLEKQKVGLVDGGKTTLKCSACDKPLAIVWMVKAYTGSQPPWNVRAACPYCNDFSFVHEVPGKFNYAGYHTTKDDNPDEVKPVTNLLDIKIESDVVTIIVKEIK